MTWIPCGVDGVCVRLQWVKLRGPEALSKSKELFKQATQLQNTLSLGAVSGKTAEDMEVRREAQGG